MAISCKMAAGHIKRAVDLDAAEVSAYDIAATLNREGVPVPREDPPAGSFRNLRYGHGYALTVEPGRPGYWTHETVTELLAVTSISDGSWDDGPPAPGTVITLSVA